MISAVIYDMDGLIIDSSPFWRDAEIRAFAKLGIELTQNDVRQTAGLRTEAVVDHWFSRFPIDRKHYPTAASSILENVFALIVEQGSAMDGLIESLDFFRSKGVKLALASGSDLSLIEAVLNKFTIKDYFEVVHSAQFEPFGKPHPAVYITTAEKLGVSPLECLALEDSINGMISAKAARMKCIGVPERELLGDKRLGIADIILPSLSMIDDTVWAGLSGTQDKPEANPISALSQRPTPSPPYPPQ
jgi:sugar-phosphatase